MERYVQELLDQEISVFTACTGAGAGLTSALWVPGCSAFLAGAAFPYSAEALEEFLGFKPGNVCEETAMDMAMQSYIQAYRPESNKEPVGLGLTASVATTEAHRGDHRVHLAVMSKQGMFVKTWILDKGVGAEARKADGKFCDDLAVIMLADITMGRTRMYGDQTLEALERLFLRPVFKPLGRGTAEDLPEDVAIFPGVFNPPHDGHFGVANQIPGSVVFALTIDPPHKPSMDLSEILKRAKQMQGTQFMVSRGDALYIQKCRQYPGRPFVVGADALLRVLDPKWGVDVEDLLAEFTACKTLFYVVGRLVDGRWTSLNDVLPKVPEAYRDRFLMVEGRWDISSTEIRQGAA